MLGEMKKRYRLRYDRVIITALVLLILIILLTLLACHKGKEEKTITDNGVSSEAEQVTSTVYDTTTATVTSASCTITTVVTTHTSAVTQIDYPECKASAFYSLDDKEIIYSDTIDARIAPASLTKLITASVALKYADKNDIFTVGSEQSFVSVYSSLCGLQTGNMLTLEDLITGMLMSSGNDAAYTIAVSVARELEPDKYMSDYEAVDYFCGLMNSFAREIGMKDTNFVNPDGWDDDAQYTTVADLLKTAEYAYSVPLLRDITGTYEKTVTLYSGETYTWTNSNLLLDPYSDYYCEEAVGMKTGTTLSAGNNLIAVFSRNGRKYISVVCGCLSDNERYELTLELLSAAVRR